MKFTTIFIALLPIVVVTAAPNPQEDTTNLETFPTIIPSETGSLPPGFPTTSVTGSVSIPESSLISTTFTNPVTVPTTSVPSTTSPTTTTPPTTTTAPTTTSSSSPTSSAPQTTSTNAAFAPRVDNMAAAGIIAGIIAAIV